MAENVLKRSRIANESDNIFFMSDYKRRTPVTNLGRTMQADRKAHGWSLRQFGEMVGVHFANLSQVENGHRAFNENLAIKCDDLFPERRGWYLQFYEESRDWAPAGFRDWDEHEESATELLVWCPNIIDGTAQTEGYARELISAWPGTTPEVADTRLQGRMRRQKRLLRANGPRIALLVDHVALYRGVGSAEIMSEQCSRLAAVSQLNAVTLQVVPPVQIPLPTALVIIADNAAYTENALSGAVYTDEESVRGLRLLFDNLRGEAAKMSESLAMIREAQRRWTGARAHTAGTVARPASK